MESNNRTNLMWLRLQILYWCFVRIVKWSSRDLNSVVTERATTASLELLAIAVQVKPGFSEITDQECRALISWNISNVLFPQKCLQDFLPVTKYITLKTDQVCTVKQSSFIAPSFRQNECVLLLSFKAEVICFSRTLFSSNTVRQISFCLLTHVLY